MSSAHTVSYLHDQASHFLVVFSFGSPGAHRVVRAGRTQCAPTGTFAFVSCPLSLVPCPLSLVLRPFPCTLPLFARPSRPRPPESRSTAPPGQGSAACGTARRTPRRRRVLQEPSRVDLPVTRDACRRPAGARPRLRRRELAAPGERMHDHRRDLARRRRDGACDGAAPAGVAARRRPRREGQLGAADVLRRKSRAHPHDRDAPRRGRRGSQLRV
jgi:hypothetical protein